MLELIKLSYTQKKKFICLLLTVTCLVLFEESEWVKPCKFAVVVSIGQKTKTKKTKERHKVEEEQKFLALGDLARSRKKVFIEDLFLARWFLRQQQTYMMEWLRDKVMFLKLTTMRYFLSRKEQESVVFVKEEFLH